MDLVKILRAEVFEYAQALATPIPLRQETLYTRQGYLIKLTDDGGHSAWGEAAPLPGFSREDLVACRGTLIAAAAALVAREDMAEDGDWPNLGVFKAVVPHSAAYFAVESAWRQLVALSRDIAPWHLYAEGRDETLLLNALLTGDEATIRMQATRAVELGYRAVKLKVGREKMTDDLRLVEMVRSIVGPTMELRLDANQAWSLDDATLFGKAVAGFDVAYIEEPCSSPFELPSFHAETGVDYAIDESIQRIHDRIQEQEHRPEHGPFRDLPILPVVQGAKAIVWKPTLIHSPELGRFLFEETAPGQTRILVLSGAFETGVGTAALAAYAAMFSAPETPVGLDTYRWMDPDVLRERLPLDRGVADLYAVCVAGQNVDEARLTKIWPN